jgi:hypothetical protein
VAAAPIAGCAAGSRPDLSTNTSAVTSDPPVAISQIYGGGGNASATFSNDFVELHNRTATSVALDGLSVQYASATGTGNFGASASQLAVLAGTLPPGGYYLVKLASGGAAGASLWRPS